MEAYRTTIARTVVRTETGSSDGLEAAQELPEAVGATQFFWKWPAESATCSSSLAHPFDLH
ncbi:hypothetical protein GCM10012287_46950 [Streptomyces daqingensis]|uniref:Uncharacterized protein n=1 Tax=Streptomyces daqingensis TaxID=1472640 RepID=A0ABQ2MPE7_9ACTN|nr:hypothetical protein GCM10012287_46950 [Streptomyces daqingensis]